MRIPSYHSSRRRRREARRFEVEQLESRQLLAVVLSLPSTPVPALEGSALDIPLVSSSNGAVTSVMNPNLTGASIDAAGHFHWTPPDGPASVTLQVTLTDADGAAGSATGTFSIDVQNVDPDAGVSGPAAAVPGQSLTYVLTAVDPSTVDTAAGFGFTVDWGDGSPLDQFSAVASGQTVGHTYVATGTYTVIVTATDKDGGHDSATQSVSVTPAALQDDPVYGGKMLAVGGTQGNDQIVLNPSHGVKVILNGKSQGNFAPTSRVVVYGQDGNDNIQVAGGVRLPAWLYGGNGNDRLKGGNGNDFLFGGPGDDSLLGGQGNDLLVGDVGADQLNGGPGDDVLVAGSVDANLTETQIKTAVNTWAGSAKTAADADTLKTSLGVTDDTDVDKLQGASGVDAFFYQLGVDVAPDQDILGAANPHPNPHPNPHSGPKPKKK